MLLGHGRCFFFACIATLRTAPACILLTRPLVLAFFFGYATHSLHMALPLGIILELFWVDVQRLGTVVPPCASFAFLLIFPCTLLFGWHDPAYVPLPLLLCLALAHAAKWLEHCLRARNDRCIEGVEAWIQAQHTGERKKITQNISPPLSPAQAVLRAVMRTFLCSAALYVLCFGALYALTHFLAHTHALPHCPHVTWHMLYLCALLGSLVTCYTHCCPLSIAPILKAWKK